MKISPINSSISSNTFKGTLKILEQKCYGNEYKLKDGDTKDIPKYYDSRTEYFIKVNSHPNARIEKTLDDYHSKITGKVYFADPEEYIPETLKEQVDFVVHDEVPRYPDVNLEVSKSYFDNSDVTNYAKKFEDIRDYYYRLQIADMKTAEEYRSKLHAGIDTNNSKEKLDYYNDRITKSKYQHDQAMDCLDIYNKGYDLRCQKGKVAEELKDLYNERYDLYRRINLAKSDIKASKARITGEEEDIKIIQDKIKAYKQLEKMPQEIRNLHHQKWLGEKYIQTELNLNLFQNEADVINQKMPQLQCFIKAYTDSIANLKIRIQDNISFLKEAPQKLKELEQKISFKQESLNEIKGKLIPLFDELKHYYAARRILG